MNVPMSRWLQAALCGLVLSLTAHAANPPPTQLFYVPFPEDNQLAGFNSITTVAVDPQAVFVTFSAATDNTVIYYDHWEDGYERDITNPTQSTTLVFGDGNSANGYPPGNASDMIPAGTVFSLRNYVVSTTLQSVLDYDARDKVASYKPISLTKTVFPAATNTLLGGCVEVFEKGLWGTEYRVPVGTDMPTTTATSSLTWDADIFSYTALSIMAGANGATVQIDADNNGSFESTVTLAEGESTYVTNVLTGGRVVSDNPVQVIMFTGRIGSTYQSRDTSLLPTYRWSTSYYAPVSTSATYGTSAFLYNPGTSAITVSYDYRNSASTYTTATVSVPAGGSARVTLSPNNGSSNFGAYHFYTTGGSPPVFYAFCAVDSASTTTTNNQAFDGGFTLVGQPSLTTQILVSLGIGRDPYSATEPTQNGNPVWLTTVGNGHTQETVYVDYNGDNAGPLTDPNGNKYDVALSLRELEQAKIFDPDGDQSGLLVYTLNPAVKIAAAWAQDPLIAFTAQPGLDVSTLLPPLREGESGKKSSLFTDADGDGEVSAGDTLEYDIRAANSARAAIPGPFRVQDNLPANVNYVAGSTRYRFSVDGGWQTWVAISDDGSGTAFPLDGSGYSVPGSLGKGQQLQVIFNATIKTYGDLTGSTVVNTGYVEISPYGLVLPIDWTDVIHGSIGDRLWSDLDGDGVQDVGESGIPGIEVFADLNNNGIRDTGEPQDVTNSNGEYLLAGLVAGTYTVRVDIADISAINVGYGPTSDLDGLTTLNSASVTLAGAQDRVDADFGYRIGASVGDRVWMDRDADGVQENGEPGISSVRVYLDLDNDDAFDAGEPNAITTIDGVYYIGNLNSGTYTVRVDTSTLPSGAIQSYDLNGGPDHEASVSLLASEHRGDLDFGYRGNLSIGDLVWEDSNGNGLVTLISSTTYNIINGRIDINNDGSVTSSDDGFIGSMRVINGYADIDNDNAATIDNGDDGFFMGYTIVNGGFDINAGGTITTADDGSANYDVYESGIASVRVFADMNNDGVFEASEPSALTNSSGIYSITNLYNGTFTVRVEPSTLPSSYVQTHDLTSPLTDHTATVVLSGSNRTDVDFGYRNDASIGDLVWNDRDADGVRDAGESGIEGVIVYIDADNDNIFDQGLEPYDITDVDGAYHIENLAAGTYSVRVEFSTLPQGVTQTYDLDSTLDHETSRALAISENANNADFGYRASASFGDYVWNDLDADGVQDGGESGISGVRVYLDTNGNGIFDSASEPSAMTNASGAYSIGNLLPGTFTARIDPSTLSAGFVQTHDLVGGLDHAATFSLSSTQARTDIDFGYTQQVVIGNLVWNDADADGQQDAGESGLDGVTVTLFNASNDTIAGATVTAEGGAYGFNVMPGTYYAVFDAPAGYDPTITNQGADASDSDASVSTGRTPDITMAGGQSNTTIDAGFYQPGGIFGHLYIDTNGDGNQNPGEADLADVDVIITDVNGNTQTVSTDSSGNWTASVPPGSTTANVDETDPQYPIGYFRTEGADPTTVTAVSGNSVNAGNDGYYIPGSISGTVLADTDNDGDGDLPLANVTLRLLDSIGNPVLEGLGQPVTTITLANGTYSFSGVVPGDYCVVQDQPSNYNSVSDTDGPNDNIIGNVTPITVTGGSNSGGNDFIEIELGLISGYVRTDDDNNGSGDTGLGGVVLNLLDGSGNPVLDGLGDPIRVATNGSGFYQFTLVPAGIYRVSQNQPAGFASVSDVDGGNPNLIGNTVPITVGPGDGIIERDFVEIELGTISGYVFVGSTPLGGVTLTLLDENGDPVDGDPITPGVQPVATVTSGTGFYQFSGVTPGTYQVGQTQPYGYDSFGDIDGGDINIIGDVTPITLLPGQSSLNNNFVESLDTCPDDWAHWKFLHPTEIPSGNPDQDAYDNFAEFAFAMPHDNGAGSTWLGNTAWIIQRAKLAPETLEGVFIRHKGAPLNTVYNLQYAAVPGNPTVWQSIEITPAMFTTVPNSDCTETVTIHDLETLTGLTGGKGIVRIKADLDDDGGNDEVDHTSYTETEGWTETPIELCCRTYNNPYLRESVFTGTVSGVSGQDIAFVLSGGTADLATVLTGSGFYLEVTSGDNEGHRFDIASASGNTVTLVNDASLHASTAPFSTLTGGPPSDLTGDAVVIRRHWTLDEIFPPSGFGATDSQSTADQVQIFAGGAWTIYWLYDENDGNPATARWVDSADSGLAGQGATVIPPGQGMFFNSRSSVTSILACGEVRPNDFIRPLSSANNLVGGGYPVDQSANSTNGRAMNLATGFFGSRDFKTADSFFVWNADNAIGAAGYGTYFLLNGAPVQPSIIRWVKIGDTAIAPRDSEVLLRGNRSVFIRAKNPLMEYMIPSPWTP